MRDITYTYKTKPFNHQKECFKQSRLLTAFAYLMEQGTGKTWVGINTAAFLYEQDLIDALLVIAPNEGDIPLVWVEQIKTHMPDRIDRTCVRAGGTMRASEKKRLEFILSGEPRDSLGLRVISTNIESTRATAPLFNRLISWCRKFRVMCVVDESIIIANHSSKQTKGVLKIAANCHYKRIVNGTLTGNRGPLDAFSQFYFLDPKILGFDLFSTFKAHYCELLPPYHPLVKHTAQKIGGSPDTQTMMRNILQIPARDAMGNIIYKNMDELNARIKKYSFRCLKKDCLDLPPKIYLKRYVELTKQQRKIYNAVRDEVIAEFEHMGELNVITCEIAMIRLLRLQQIICNHYCPDPDPDQMKTAKMIEQPKTIKGVWTTQNPRMAMVLKIIGEEAEDARGIIWCRHHPEIAECVDALTRTFGADKVVQMHGDVKKDNRAASRHAFQDRKSPVQWMVAQVRSGKGIDLYEANYEIFYSNDHSYINRVQAEDRAHRIGLKHSVNIYDLVAHDTQDQKIIDALRGFQKLSDVILGDHPKNWI
jgi:hypothetical protein